MGTSNDPELNDDVLGSEIELLADLIDAASGYDALLSQEQVDNALHVVPCPTSPHSRLVYRAPASRPARRGSG